MNKEIFYGFIQGVTAMYKLENDLNPLLHMKWDVRLKDGKCLVSCRYNTFICDRLINPGDYDFPPEYKTIVEREEIEIECEISNNLDKMAYQIKHEILEVLTLINPDNVLYFSEQ